MAKKEKICIVCGNEFFGTGKAECCGSNCRVRLKRILDKGGQPEFRLVGGKNTPVKIKIQDLTEPTNIVKAQKPIGNQKSNFVINTTQKEGIPPMPKREDFESGFKGTIDFGAAKSEWKIKYNQ